MKSQQDSIPTHALTGEMALDNHGRVLRKPNFLTKEEHDAVLARQRERYTKPLKVNPRYNTSQFRSRRLDKTWGPQNYAVTASQRESIISVVALLIDFPGFFCEQSKTTGAVTVGYAGAVYIRSVIITRHGRVTGQL